MGGVRGRVGVGATTRQPSSDGTGGFDWQAKNTSLTPQRSGLSGRAMRMQSHEKGERAEGDSHESGSVVELDSAPRTTFKGILKKLDFPSTVQATPAGQTIHAPMTATKRLTFTSHLGHTDRGRESSSWNTPLSSTNGRMVFGSLGAQMTMERRRVTFGRVTDDDDGVIAEGDEGEEEHDADKDVCHSVNSRNAGSTPFDKRLSSLFNRYTPSEEGSDIDHVIEHATEDSDGGITKDQLASALRRSLLFVDRYNRSKAQEGDTQRPPMYGVISPTTGVLSMPFREEDRTPSMSRRRSSAGFSFAPAATPERPQYSGTPDFSFSSPKTENTRRLLTPQSCSPNLLTLYGKARRVVPEEETADMVAAMSLKDEHVKMPRRSPRLAKKKRDSLPSQNASSGGKLKLSPTEQSIRNSLRRKSTLGNSNST